MTEPEPRPSPGSIGKAVAEAPGGSLTLDWSAILQANASRLRRVIAARLNESQAVDEVMQEVALAAVAQRAPLLNPANLLGWLYRLAVRQTLMYRRKAGRQRELLVRYGQRRAGGAVDPRPSPLGWLMHDERRGLIQQAIRRLPPRDADLLTLKYAEGLTTKELAANLNISISAVEARLHRARHRLRDTLATLAAEFSTEIERSEDDQS